MRQKEKTFAKLTPQESHEPELYPFINPLSKLYSEVLGISPTCFPRTLLDANSFSNNENIFIKTWL